jgi:hypothetical protein
MTPNQKTAKYVLGYVPKGYVLVAEDFYSSGLTGKSKARVFIIYVDGKPIACTGLKTVLKSME